MITLKNDAGQVVTCGGGTGGSVLGGAIGYNIQKSGDEKCAQEFEAKGYKRQ